MPECTHVEKCRCKTTWTAPQFGKKCAVPQSGCPGVVCDGHHTPWCMVENPGCATEASGEGGGWSHCTPGIVNFVVLLLLLFLLL